MIVQKVITDALSTDEIKYINDIVLSAYGVAQDDVTIDPKYELEGVVNADINGLVDPNVALENIEEALSNVLNVPDKNIHVFVDPETDEIKFKVIDSSFDNLSSIKGAMGSDNFVDDMNKAMDKINIDIAINDLNVSDDINANIEITVDVTETDVTNTEGEKNVSSTLGEEWSVNSEGILTFIRKINIFLCWFLS